MALRRQPAIPNPEIPLADSRHSGPSLDGGLEFRGSHATLKLNRGGFSVYREGVPAKTNPVVRADKFEDGTISHIHNFFDCIKSRKEPNAPVETGIAAARAGHIVNLAYHRGGQITWPPKSPA